MKSSVPLWLLLAAAGLAAYLVLKPGAPAPSAGQQAVAFTELAEPNHEELLHSPQPARDGRPMRLSALDSLACAECHGDIADEWSRSLHALAWEDQRFQDAMAKKRKPKSCQGCHIPEPILHGPIGRKPQPRADSSLEPDPDAPLAHNPRHFGISCLSCHSASDGAMLGPIPSAPGDEISDAHASRQHEAFGEGKLANALCIACHRTNVGPVIGIAKDFETTRQADKGLSCVGCHMAPVERSNASGTDANGEAWSSPVRKGRSHELQTPRDPRFLALAFGLEAERTPTGAKLIVSNRAAHRVPGLRDRSMTFTVRSLDANGQVLGQTEYVIETDSYLAVDASIEIEVAGQDAVRLDVHAAHLWGGREQPVTFIERQLQL